jgi:colicin import membrane protein
MRAPPLLAVLLALLAPGLARAESPTEARLRDALRAAQGQVKALEDERAAAQADEARQKQDQAALKALRVENAALKAQLAAAQRSAGGGPQVAALKAQLDEHAALVASQRESLQRCEAAAQQLDASTRAVEELRGRLAELEALKARAAACDARNARLYRVGKDIIDWLSRLGVGDAVAAREPFLGLKRVELENAAQDFEDKLLEHRSTP